MHHCNVLCLVLSSLCSMQAYYFYALVLILLAPPTHFTRASHAKSRYLNSRLMILHAICKYVGNRAIQRGSESKTYVCDIDRDCKATNKFKGNVFVNTCKHTY